MAEKNKNTTSFHPKNIHKEGYDFLFLIKTNPSLKEFVFPNKFKNETIDFGDPKAVKELNRSLLMAHYNIQYWDFPDDNLCPPIPSRADYVHHLADLLNTSEIQNKVRVLDIGTGANCIYPLLGNALYQWDFVGTDISQAALNNVKVVFQKNHLEQHFELRLQKKEEHILNGILEETDRFAASMCNPPFFASVEDVEQSHHRKLKGLGRTESKFSRNFSGMHHELVFRGGEKAFLHNYLYESSFFKTQCFWYSTLVSKKENVKSMVSSLEKLNAKSIKIIPLQHGNKISRIVAWTFLDKKEQNQWKMK